MKTYHVTYYYLATGMEGRADTQDYGFVQAISKEDAIDIICNREEPDNEYNRNWLKGCLTAVEIVTDIEESQHERDLRAERALISITLPMSDAELTLFLDEIGCERLEYDYLLHKHSRLVDRWKEETQKEKDNVQT